ncbi:HEPN domain-containing protein [uncultured Azohydromonas sp.]|uniref:HEPN domain-containing protein n=1 Tax=uncultured Azohydromonas sp. TaxID=487342 RepID=UPI00261A714C|nr:HEPN domain-containing protein [uncultured Azohydromonas sp.]
MTLQATTQKARMSSLALPQGDDHPEAARKHLTDSSILLNAGRADGAAYLSGYVAECSLKSLWLYETGVPPAGTPLPWGRRGHDLSHLHSQATALAAVAGARTARYVGNTLRTMAGSSLFTWNSEHRYHAPGMTLRDATAWHNTATQAYQESVGQMYLDGVL